MTSALVIWPKISTKGKKQVVKNRLYRASSRTARAMKRNPVLKNKTNKTSPSTWAEAGRSLESEASLVYTVSSKAA